MPNGDPLGLIQELQSKLATLQQRVEHLESQENAGQVISGGSGEILLGSSTFRGSSYPTFLLIRDTGAASGGVNVARFLVITTADMADQLATGFRVAIQDDTAGPFDIATFQGERWGGDKLGRVTIGARGPQDTATNALSGVLTMDYNALFYKYFRGDNSNGLLYDEGYKYIQVFPSTAIANTLVETSLLTGGALGSLTFPADFWYTTGRPLHGKLRGYFSVTGTPTLRIKVKLGGSILLDTGAIATAGVIGANYWEIDFSIVCQAIGGSGNFAGYGKFDYDNAGHTGTKWGMVNSAGIVLNTGAALALDVTAQWGAASPSNTITCTDAGIAVKA